MHAYILVSLSSAETLRKHLTELNAFRNWQRRSSVDVGSVPLDGFGILLTMVMSRLFNWGNGSCEILGRSSRS